MLSPLAKICIELYDSKLITKDEFPDMVIEEVLNYLKQREEVKDYE